MNINLNTIDWELINVAICLFFLGILPMIAWINNHKSKNKYSKRSVVQYRNHKI
jgi:hypothetical protein